ncbi:MAG: 5'-methylthioadenosine/S-adenosylhomocysteine nucleosidase [bacterium]|nr:5'-methylthioadenosine/S-adenosylhomocysteine nucleosidase [bacterium]
MALSDSCFQFLDAVSKAAGKLAEDVHHYSTPDYPIEYGEEIDALRRACSAVANSPFDAEKGAHLLRLAELVLRSLDGYPRPPKPPEQRAKVKTLVKLLQSGTNSLEASEVPLMVDHLIYETPLTKLAIERLKTILPSLKQKTFDEVIDIISDVGSEPVKRESRLYQKLTGNSDVHVDIGIITIKDEELNAVLDNFQNGSVVYISPTTHRHYNLRVAEAGNGSHYQVGIIRQPEQGNGEAQSAARDLIEDLAPRLILVVGIAGGLPSKDYTLGDVILSLRILDYSVEARKEGHNPTYTTSGGPVGKHIENHVANLSARRKDLGNWIECLPARPPIILNEANLYGSDDWKREVRESLEYHSASNAKTPNFYSGIIASSDRLIKDTEVLIPWLQTNRNLLAVEMESGGVYRAARERCAMLAIRGISDIVGFKRDERWTQYACASAAAFARAYLLTTPIDVVGYTR